MISSEMKRAKQSVPPDPSCSTVRPAKTEPSSGSTGSRFSIDDNRQLIGGGETFIIRIILINMNNQILIKRRIIFFIGFYTTCT